MTSVDARIRAAGPAVLLALVLSCLSTLASPVLAAAPAPAAGTLADAAPLLGRWRNVNPQTRGWTRMVLAPSQGNVGVRYWGACSPTDCGPFTAIAAPGKTLAFSTNDGFATRRWTVWRNRSGRLVVVTRTHFTDGSGRKDYRMTNRFRLVQRILLPASRGVVVEAARLPLPRGGIVRPS